MRFQADSSSRPGFVLCPPKSGPESEKQVVEDGTGVKLAAPSIDAVNSTEIAGAAGFSIPTDGNDTTVTVLGFFGGLAVTGGTHFVKTVAIGADAAEVAGNAVEHSSVGILLSKHQDPMRTVSIPPTPNPRRFVATLTPV